ncbi:hypothetical protein GCM10010109_52280 [Actinoplanes campanulatus]|nr:hypothetical protein GCM10010109_52280 [Actinoplanes campanulatus]GID41378.1 hypothetical protein Aca09nite_78840 [Actinoplanes campanulatus]
MDSRELPYVRLRATTRVPEMGSRVAAQGGQKLVERGGEEVLGRLTPPERETFLAVLRRLSS